MIQEKIYEYFERNPWLKVLFIFNDEFIAMELETLEWRNGYRYVDFRGDWFTTKYRLDNEWAHDKVILYFHQPSPLQVKSLQAGFPLMDVLTANMEYHHQDYAAFIQQYDIPVSMTGFVEKNIRILQSEALMKMLTSYYADKSINEDIAVRAILSYYLKVQRVLDWDTLLLRILFLGREAESKNRLDFFANLRKTPSISNLLSRKFADICGVTIEDDTTEKVGTLTKVIKYNAITQGLAVSEADNYQSCRITDSMALQHLNRLLELAISQEKTAKMLTELFNELGGEIRDEEIIRWYGPDANYYFISDALCEPIVKALLEKKVETEPTAVIRRIEELVVKHGNNGVWQAAVDYTLLVARFYEKALSVGSPVLNTPNEYITRYREDYYLIDQLYRQSLETYYKVDKSIELFECVQKVKLQLDVNYSKFVNRLNMEWTKCVKAAGGMSAVKLLRQEDFYEQKVMPVKKKLAVIVSDALRYEVAQELLQEIAKGKHIARLEPALAMLPTETKYCKPALFPHKSLSLYGSGGDQDMSVDHKILSDTNKRSEHLASYKADALCVDFSKVSAYIQDRNREIFKHPLVYVMHDAIDNEGHNGSAENVVKACRKAVHDINELTRKILESYNVTEVIITADHGFLFNDVEFADKDKHKITEEYLERKSRYYLTHSAEEFPGMVKYPLSEVSGMDNVSDVFVAAPIGTNRLNVEGGDYMFAHGGGSLQEMMIPVILCHKEVTDNKQPVGVMILDRNLSIQSSRIRFKLLQTEAVSMEMKARTVLCAIYYNDKPVTPIKQVELDKTDALLDNRKIQVDLTLNTHVDAKVLQLRVYDEEDTLNPLLKENVTNNTLISNDFDF
jgi:uncharacterized protein (TIGR02687 family)